MEVELDDSGNVKHINVDAPDGLVARKEGSSWYYYTFDQQGNVSQKFDVNQTIKSTRLCNAWGEGMETENPRSPDVFGYNAKWGYYLDRETELYVTQHRMYDASTGRFLNRDPIGYAGGVNLYGYCGAGPVGQLDPTGLIYDSMSRFCARYPAFCVELANELGGGFGAAGPAVAGGGATVIGGAAANLGGRMASQYGDDVIEGAVEILGKCVEGVMGKARFGTGAHKVIQKHLGKGGLNQIEVPLGNGRADALSGPPFHILEIKPATFPGIGRGLGQLPKYTTHVPGSTGDVLPYPAPWFPQGWDWVDPWFGSVLP